jgi:hypothetical protein
MTGRDAHPTKMTGRDAHPTMMGRPAVIFRSPGLRARKTVFPGLRLADRRKMRDGIHEMA